MTRSELELAWAYNRTLYYGSTPVKIQQLSSPWSKSEFAVVKSSTNPNKQWRASWEELTVMQKQQGVAL